MAGVEEDGSLHVGIEILEAIVSLDNKSPLLRVGDLTEDNARGDAGVEEPRDEVARKVTP